MMNGFRPHQYSADLEAVRQSLSRLIEDIPIKPRAVRVRAGKVAIELEWDPAEHVVRTPDQAVAVDERLRQEPVATATESTAESKRHLRAPAVGVFYRRSAPGAKPFVIEGDIVEPGQQVGLVEAMKIMIPVETEERIRVVEILKPDGESVEYDEPLMVVELVDVAQTAEECQEI